MYDGVLVCGCEYVKVKYTFFLDKLNLCLDFREVYFVVF